MTYTGLEREDRKVEYHADFMLGGPKASAKLETNKLYTLKELSELVEGKRGVNLINSKAPDVKQRWRCVRMDEGVKL